MTVEEIQAARRRYLGETVLIATEDDKKLFFQVVVREVGMKLRYGNLRVRVVPVAGLGSKWINASRIIDQPNKTTPERKWETK